MKIAEITGRTVKRQLGVGGMKQMFLAQRPHLPRQEALRLLDAPRAPGRAGCGLCRTCALSAIVHSLPVIALQFVARSRTSVDE
ncbi:hypothetical protein [Mycolicibacterium hodleri]|uniref:hypothetical protein n=1 Tax=Mycolicibacterium hodleri TaxID=49897 RepID=UPI001C8D456F|nr:hypothetical protein [Mycolicibacterium hodleri]